MTDSGGAGHVSNKFEEIDKAWKRVYAERKLCELLSALGIRAADSKAGIFSKIKKNIT